MKNFIFGVLTYNHSAFIIEHLESIKYLIESYGADYEFKIVIADDASKDNTIVLAQAWLELNKSLFAESIVLTTPKNIGTSANYTRLLQNIDSEYFKVTAGDDVYSYENLFEDYKYLQSYDFVCGQPLLLVDHDLYLSKNLAFNISASEILYRNRPLRDRVALISVTNTPNLFYRKNIVCNDKIYDFLTKFKVVEDYPTMAKVSEIFPKSSFLQTNRVFVYYRRTSNSIYLIRTEDFNEDKLNSFLYLVETEKSRFRRLLMLNRIWCYKQKNTFVKNFLNINYYLYFLDLLFNILPIYRFFVEFQRQTDMSKHEAHFKKIKSLSDPIIASVLSK